MPTIRLQSSDGEVFPVEIEIAKQSVTIKTMLEDLGIDEDEEEIVPLPNVNAAILKRVINWWVISCVILYSDLIQVLWLNSLNSRTQKRKN